LPHCFGSTLAKREAYGRLLGLPDRLPFTAAENVYAQLLAALGQARSDPSGQAASSLLTSQGTPAGAVSPAEASRIVSEFVSRVEELVVAGAQGQASSSSANQPPAPAAPDLLNPIVDALPALPPLAPLPPLPPPLPDHSAPLPLDPFQSFLNTAQILAAGHLLHTLSAAERAQLRAALDENLSVLAPIGSSDRSRLLDGPLLQSLLDSSVAQLYACLLSAMRSGTIAEPLSALVEELNRRVSAIVGTVEWLT